MATCTEQFRPLRVSKGFFIDTLRMFPDQMNRAFPEWDGTLDELIEELESDPREWMDEFADDPTDEA